MPDFFKFLFDVTFLFTEKKLIFNFSVFQNSVPYYIKLPLQRMEQ